MKMTPFLEYVMYDVLSILPSLHARAMMGGYTLYNEGKVFAIVEGENLWFKGSKETESWYKERGAKKFSYYKTDTKTGKKKKQEMNYFHVPETVIEDKEALDIWLNTALDVSRNV